MRISQIRALRYGWCREPLSIHARLGLRPCRPCAGWGDRARENVVSSCSFFLYYVEWLDICPPPKLFLWGQKPKKTVWVAGIYPNNLNVREVREELIVKSIKDRGNPKEFGKSREIHRGSDV